MAGWLLVVQVALWAGIVRDLSAHTLSLRDTYPLLLFAIFALYLHAPLIIGALRRPAAPGRPIEAMA
jgi:hypothetical protein